MLMRLAWRAERAAKRLKPKTLTEVTRSLREHWKPLHAVPLTKVVRVAVAAQLGRIAKERGPSAANRSRAYLATLYSWAIAEGLTDSNPIVGTNKAAEEISRDRVFSDEELRLVWSCAGEGCLWRNRPLACSFSLVSGARKPPQCDGS